ncbi:MAG: DUF4185 domain-containing protein [Planctomycetes bacterium]|nr:DUF4185 domain-containing protein [Planctomycetota bacterium]
MRTLLLVPVLLLIAACAGEDDGSSSSKGIPGVSGFTASQGDTLLTLSWTNPTFADFAGVEVRRDTVAAPVLVTDGVSIYVGVGFGATDSGLTNGVRYFYTAFVQDSAGKYSAGVSISAVPNPSGSVQITFAGVGGGGGSHGIFDPSLAADPATGRIWMSYSEVLDSVMWPGQNALIQTRLAYSDDSGLSWTDTGTVLNPAQDITLPVAAPNNAGTWVNEVSTLVRDPNAPAAERWKLMWHHYLTINGVRAFDHGWIAMRSAPDPAGVWSPERKLFVGSLYNTADNAIIGPPEVQLDQLHADLNSALVFSEPGLLVNASGLHVSMLAADGTTAAGRVVLVRLPTGGATWQYRGSFMVNATDGPALGCDGLSAPALYEQEGAYSLIATPQTNSFYEGTLLFRITDLSTASIARLGGVPQTFFTHFGTSGSFNGASAYVPEATASGLIYCEAQATAPIVFEMYASRRNP